MSPVDVRRWIKFSKNGQQFRRLCVWRKAQSIILMHATLEAILSKPNHNLAVRRALRIRGKALSQRGIWLYHPLLLPLFRQMAKVNLCILREEQNNTVIINPILRTPASRNRFLATSSIRFASFPPSES